MNFLDSNTVAGIRAASAGLFWDYGVILQRETPASSTKYGDYGANFGDYDDEHSSLEIKTVCRLSIRGMTELAQWNELVQGIGSLLLPIAQVPNIHIHDRFKLTQKFGQALSKPYLFAVEGEPYIALLGLKMDVRLIPGDYKASAGGS